MNEENVNGNENQEDTKKKISGIVETLKKPPFNYILYGFFSVVFIFLLLLILGFFSSDEGDHELRTWSGIEKMSMFLDPVEYLNDYFVTIEIEFIVKKDEDEYLNEIESNIQKFTDKIKNVISEMNYFEINTIEKREKNLKPKLLRELNNLVSRPFIKDIYIDVSILENEKVTSAIDLTIGRLEYISEGGRSYISPYEVDYKDNTFLKTEVIFFVNTDLSQKYKLIKIMNRFQEGLMLGKSYAQKQIESYKNISNQIKYLILNCSEDESVKLNEEISRKCYEKYKSERGKQILIQKIRQDETILNNLEEFFTDSYGNKQKFYIQNVLIPLYYLDHKKD